VEGVEVHCVGAPVFETNSAPCCMVTHCGRMLTA
jgi:hypothetical protein